MGTTNTTQKQYRSTSTNYSIHVGGLIEATDDRSKIRACAFYSAGVSGTNSGLMADRHLYTWGCRDASAILLRVKKNSDMLQPVCGVPILKLCVHFHDSLQGSPSAEESQPAKESPVAGAPKS